MTIQPHEFVLVPRPLLPRSSRFPLGEIPEGDIAITSVSGTFLGDSTITVQGSGFGSNGPDIVMFDDFEGVAAGEVIPLTNPQIGQWSESSGNPIAFNLGRSGSRSFASGDGIQRQLRLVTPDYHTDIFVSYWVRLAPGTYFPGSSWPNGRTLNTFSADSSWKYVWLMEDGGYSHNDGLFDITVPTHTGSGGHQSAAGNAARLSDRWIGSSWFNWEDWMRVSFTLSSANPRGITHIISQGKTPLWREHATVDHAAYNNGERINQLNIPGWVHNATAGDVNPLYDDIYVSVGPGAAARVEIANSANYTEADHIELLLADSWSSTQITAQIPSSVTIPSGTWYVFVHKSDSTRNNTGYQIIVGE